MDMSPSNTGSTTKNVWKKQTDRKEHNKLKRSISLDDMEVDAKKPRSEEPINKQTDERVDSVQEYLKNFQKWTPPPQTFIPPTFTHDELVRHFGPNCIQGGESKPKKEIDRRAMDALGESIKKDMERLHLPLSSGHKKIIVDQKAFGESIKKEYERHLRSQTNEHSHTKAKKKLFTPTPIKARKSRIAPPAKLNARVLKPASGVNGLATLEEGRRYNKLPRVVIGNCKTPKRRRSSNSFSNSSGEFCRLEEECGVNQPEASPLSMLSQKLKTTTLNNKTPNNRNLPNDKLLQLVIDEERNLKSVLNNLKDNFLLQFTAYENEVSKTFKKLKGLCTQDKENMSSKFSTTPKSNGKNLRITTLNKMFSKSALVQDKPMNESIKMYDNFRKDFSCVLDTPKKERDELRTPMTTSNQRILSINLQKQCLSLMESPS